MTTESGKIEHEFDDTVSCEGCGLDISAAFGSICGNCQEERTAHSPAPALTDKERVLATYPDAKDAVDGLYVFVSSEGKTLGWGVTRNEAWANASKFAQYTEAARLAPAEPDGEKGPLPSWRDLAMLLRRCVVRLQVPDEVKGNKLADQVMDYLRRTGLASGADILRVASPEVRDGKVEIPEDLRDEYCIKKLWLAAGRHPRTDEHIWLLVEKYCALVERIARLESELSHLKAGGGQA